jgi:large subunit ribosomal protein L9
MKIILRQDVAKLGNIGEVVNVKDGYARNFLIPKGMAYYASPKAIRALEIEKKQYDLVQQKQREDAELTASRLADLQLTIPMQAGEGDKLFGSVTNQMIAQELELKGYTIDRRHIVIEEPIRALGTHEVKVKLHGDVVAPLKIWVISVE